MVEDVENVLIFILFALFDTSLANEDFDTAHPDDEASTFTQYFRTELLSSGCFGTESENIQDKVEGVSEGPNEDCTNRHDRQCEEEHQGMKKHFFSFFFYVGC